MDPVKYFNQMRKLISESVKNEFLRRPKLQFSKIPSIGFSLLVAIIFIYIPQKYVKLPALPLTFPLIYSPSKQDSLWWLSEKNLPANAEVNGSPP